MRRRRQAIEPTTEDQYRKKNTGDEETLLSDPADNLHGTSTTFVKRAAWDVGTRAAGACCAERIVPRDRKLSRRDCTRLQRRTGEREGGGRGFGHYLREEKQTITGFRTSAPRHNSSTVSCLPSPPNPSFRSLHELRALEDCLSNVNV